MSALQANQNDTSILLTSDENEIVFTVIGHRKQVSLLLVAEKNDTNLGIVKSNNSVEIDGL